MASCKAKTAPTCNQYQFNYLCRISHLTCKNGILGISSSVDFWYFLISCNALVPGLYLLGLLCLTWAFFFLVFLVVMLEQLWEGLYPHHGPLSDCCLHMSHFLGWKVLKVNFSCSHKIALSLFNFHLFFTLGQCRFCILSYF